MNVSGGDDTIRGAEERIVERDVVDPGVVRTQITDDSSPVTAVVVCYNHERFVVDALRSTAVQTLRPRTVIVVDDASADGSRRAITDYLSGVEGDTISLFHRTNRGLTTTLNETLALVDTEFVAFLAADDWMEPDRFRVEVDEFARCGSACAVVHSDLFQADEHGRRMERTYGEEHGHPDSTRMFQAGIERCAVYAPSALLRTAAVRSVGGFDESMPMEDFDLYLKLARDFDISFVAQPLVNYRILDTSMSRTSNPRAFKEAMLASLAKHLDIPGPDGLMVAARIEDLATMLYLRGRSPSLTSKDLGRVLRKRPRLRTAVLYSLATARIPGPLVRKLADRVTLRDPGPGSFTRSP